MTQYPRLIIIFPGILVSVKDYDDHQRQIRLNLATIAAATLTNVALFAALAWWFL